MKTYNKKSLSHKELKTKKSNYTKAKRKQI